MVLWMEIQAYLMDGDATTGRGDSFQAGVSYSPAPEPIYPFIKHNSWPHLCIGEP